MLQLSNTSPFAASMLAFPDTAGIDTLYVVVRATFEICPSGVTIADAPEPVVLADEYWGKPGESSIKYSSEAHLTKPGTDVVVVGEACAPDERPVASVDVGLGIAGRTKHARVHGDRYWTEGLGGVRPSRAKPFVRMPVIYERAFGGKHIIESSAATYLDEPRNPVGCGFVGKRSTKEMLGQPAPNVEDIRRPIGLLGERSTPVGVLGRRKVLPYRLEMIVLEPTVERFSRSWRASFPVRKKLLEIETVRVALERLLRRSRARRPLRRRSWARTRPVAMLPSCRWTMLGSVPGGAARVVLARSASVRLLPTFRHAGG